jgi:hypothetical protein
MIMEFHIILPWLPKESICDFQGGVEVKALYISIFATFMAVFTVFISANVAKRKPKE